MNYDEEEVEEKNFKLGEDNDDELLDDSLDESLEAIPEEEEETEEKFFGGY